MNDKLVKKANTDYQLAEKKAEQYFQKLYVQVMQKSYVPTLTKDIQSWKKNHIQSPLFSIFTQGKANTKEYHSYIKWLDYSGKLHPYLERSISYIFLRDLGKTLDSPNTQRRIQQVVSDLKTDLTTKQNEKPEVFSMAGLYRLAQKEKLESTMIWLVNKLKKVSTLIPKGMDATQAQRKLIKIIAGVIMHVLEELGESAAPEERSRRLEESIRLGYSYGLTYPFIDDLLDASVLSPEEKRQYSDLIRTTLITGSVPEIRVWVGRNENLVKAIHAELREAFEYIKHHQKPQKLASFYEQSYVFFRSQEVDRLKDLNNATYTNEELYIPIILKSSSSRLIVRTVISAPEDEEFVSRTFFYGIYNQLADDFADMFEDWENQAVTPYTYFMKYHNERKDLINPFELYWTVIAHLIHNVYYSDQRTCEVILSRAINGLKRFKAKLGTEKYQEIMEIFAPSDKNFNRVIQKMVKKADNVEFFDKLLRDHMITSLKNEKEEQEAFIETIEYVRNQINPMLLLGKNDSVLPLLEEPITDAANYSLAGEGKRLRPMVTWFIGVKEYGLAPSAIAPLLKSVEYMHTASLIFDDLPSQDNSSIRRGRSTLHEVYNTAIAELTGLFLTQKAIEEQSSLEQFDSKTVLRLINYSAQITAEMCKGQAKDLESKGKVLTLEQLNLMSYYKTGMAFEASLIMPAILANAKENEVEALKKFAYHAGIAFQIKDDLLDVEGDTLSLGKATGKDIENNNSTFVTVLGSNGAKKVMWDHYCLAIESLEMGPRKIPFLKHLLNYIVNRDY